MRTIRKYYDKIGKVSPITKSISLHSSTDASEVSGLFIAYEVMIILALLSICSGGNMISIERKKKQYFKYLRRVKWYGHHHPVYKSTGTPCSCWMCANPRRTQGKKQSHTNQEIRNYDEMMADILKMCSPSIIRGYNRLR